MRQGEVNPAMLEQVRAAGELPEGASYEAWGNDLYDAGVVRYRDGAAYITLKRQDRHAVHDWRHLQQIKNDVCGPEAEAVELYPAESRLVDQANQYHLWVLPPGERFPFGKTKRAVASDEEVRAFNRGREAGHHKGRQRPWQPGLTTGAGRNDDAEGS